MATKLALQQTNTRLAADNAVLREANAELRGNIEFLKTDLYRVAAERDAVDVERARYFDETVFLREQLAERDHLARKLIGRVNRGPVSAKRLAMDAAREAAKQSGQCVKVGA